MSGREYLQNIKKELQAGHYQHKKGASLLAAFGFVRRRQSAINTIVQELDKLGLRTVPAIDEAMPLDSPHIRFLLADQEEAATPSPEETTVEEVVEENEELPVESIITAFKIAELSAAATPVEWIKPSAPLSKAYTVMCLKKFSQLVVAETDRPFAIHIKGTISYQSIANVLMNRPATTVNECLDRETPQLLIDDDIGKVIQALEEHDVVLVIGRDKRLSGIITAWDLAAEFKDLVSAFKWIGEIESRVKRYLEDKLGRESIVAFLTGNSIEQAHTESNADRLTLGSLVLVVQNPSNWERLDLAFDREEFCSELDRVRELRNRLMHFRDPLDETETKKLKRFCDVVRKIPLAGS